MIVVPFEAMHAQTINIQDAQRAELEGSGVDYCALDRVKGVALTGLVDGVPIACAGVVELWNGRAQAWSLISKDAGPWMSAVTKKIRRFLADCEYRRVEMDVVSSFAAGHRWAKMLGFEFEAHKRSYYPNGVDCDGYVRIR